MTFPLRVPAPKGYPRRADVQRQLDRATLLWLQGTPHAALTVLRDAGLDGLWPLFVRTCTTWCRANPDRVARVDRVKLRARAAPKRR